MPRKRPPPSGHPPPTQPSLPAPTPLAAKHQLSASTEAEVRTAFSIFATTSSSSSPSHDPTSTIPTDIDASATMPTSALSRALAALNCGPNGAAEKRQLTESVDPTGTGEVRYEDFVALAALQLRRRKRKRGGARDEDDDSEGISDEVDAAFRLFLEAGGEDSGGKRREGEERITMKGLRKVATELGSEGGGGMGEDVLRNMIMEANGLGPEGVGRGVGKGEFADVMKRAGVF
ncbi:hypothetical protein MMC07_005968 [Pseudocyphellaria aurata]|nr:hypothetical protein [Pseudocyphellaria aurata]